MSEKLSVNDSARRRRWTIRKGHVLGQVTGKMGCRSGAATVSKDIYVGLAEIGLKQGVDD